jgi:hypothetical protein
VRVPYAVGVAWAIPGIRGGPSITAAGHRAGLTYLSGFEYRKTAAGVRYWGAAGLPYQPGW